MGRDLHFAGEFASAPSAGGKAPKLSPIQRAKVDEKLIAMFKRLRGLRAFTSDQQPCPVAPGLFIGSIGAAQNLEGLRRSGITHIVNASPMVPCFYKREFNYFHIEVHDDANEDIARYFGAANDFIEKGLQEGAVLIHCYAGVSRSAALTLAYMISNLGMDVAEALCLLRCSRPQAQPNSGFLLQLENFRDAHRIQTKRRRLQGESVCQKAEEPLLDSVHNEGTSVNE